MNINFLIILITILLNSNVGLSQNCDAIYSNLKASYSNFTNAQYVDYKTIEIRLKDCTSFFEWFYRNYKETLNSAYLVNFPKDYSISLILDPCDYKIDEDKCIANQEYWQDKYFVSTSEQLSIAWKITNAILNCNGIFKFSSNCGSFLEVHRPANITIIEELKFETQNVDEYKIEYLSTQKLCAGKYEIWLVFRTPSGYILQFVKPFFVDYPSC